MCRGRINGYNFSCKIVLFSERLDLKTPSMPLHSTLIVTCCDGVLIKIGARLSGGSDGENSASLCTWNNNRLPRSRNVVDDTKAKSHLLTPEQPCSTASSIVDLRSDVP